VRAGGSRAATNAGFPIRAVGATALFALAGIAGFFFAPAPWTAKAPNAVFYAVLVLNTFFSVRFFDALPPHPRDERAIDGLLAILYLALAAAIGTPLVFALISTLLFAAAVAKYVLLMPIMTRQDILRRKIRIDALGLVLCAATLAGTLVSDPLWSAWAAAALFALANVYLLAISPMYADPLASDWADKKKEARRAAPPRN
jgi:hypothetical protein